MKKIVYLAAVAGILVFIPLFAFAQTNDANLNTNTNSETNLNSNANLNAVTDDATKTEVEEEAEALIEDPGMLPDSPFYFLKTWGENIHFFFTFDDEDRAELEYRYALRRISEAQKLIEKGKEDIAGRHIERAEEKFERVRVRLEEQIEEGKDVESLVERLELIQAHQQEVLMDVYERVPENAKESILRAMENSAKGISNAIEHVQGSDGLERFEQEIEERVRNNGQDIKIKVKTKTEGTETETEIEIEAEDETEDVETNENRNSESDDQDEDSPESNGGSSDDEADDQDEDASESSEDEDEVSEEDQDEQEQEDSEDDEDREDEDDSSEDEES